MNKKTIEAGIIEYWFLENGDWMGKMFRNEKEALEDYESYLDTFPNRSVTLNHVTFKLVKRDVVETYHPTSTRRKIK